MLNFGYLCILVIIVEPELFLFKPFHENLNNPWLNSRQYHSAVLAGITNPNTVIGEFEVWHLAQNLGQFKSTESLELLISLKNIDFNFDVFVHVGNVAMLILDVLDWEPFL